MYNRIQSGILIGEEMERFWGENQVELKNGQILALSCFECKLMVDEMQEEMISNRKEIAGDIQNFACNKIVPSNMTDSCNDFLSIYLPTVIQMTIEQVTATGICRANKCCPTNSNMVYDTLGFQEIHTAKYENLRKFENFLAEKLARSPMVQFIEYSLVENICENLFKFLQPICHTMVNRIGSNFVNVTVELAKNGKFSEKFTVA